MNQTDEFSQENIDRIKVDMMDFLGVENVENDVKFRANLLQPQIEPLP